MFQQDTIQYSKPLFVRSRHKSVIWKGKEWTYNDLVPWQEVGIPEDKIKILFDIGLVYHNESLEKETKVGDRLVEINDEDILKLIRLANSELKKRAANDTEFGRIKIKQSKVRDKQIGLIRSWMNRFPTLADEVMFPIRDDILGEQSPKEDTTE